MPSLLRQPGRGRNPSRGFAQNNVISNPDAGVAGQVTAPSNVPPLAVSPVSNAVAPVGLDQSGGAVGSQGGAFASQAAAQGAALGNAPKPVLNPLSNANNQSTDHCNG